MKMMTPVASKVSSRFASSRESPSGVEAPSHHMYLQRNLANSKESPSGVGAPSHHIYLQRNLASMKVVIPIAKRVRRIRLTSIRESPRCGSTLSPHVPAV
jgi:hypothetical protein